MIPPAALPTLQPGTVLPADIRATGTGAQQEYRTALAFERVLLSQLTKAMQATVGGEDDDGAATRTYRDILPDTMADALVAGGGTGLASDLVRALRTEAP